MPEFLPGFLPGFYRAVFPQSPRKRGEGSPEKAGTDRFAAGFALISRLVPAFL